MQNLTELGLSQEEYITYVEVLKNPPTEISELAKRTKIKRSTLYGILASLEQKRIIYKSNKKNIKYEAVSPTKVLGYLKENKNSLDNALKSFENEIPLLNIFYENKPISHSSEYLFFENNKIPILMEDLISKSNEKILGISNHHWINLIFKLDKSGKVQHSSYLDTVMRVGDRFVFSGNDADKDFVSKFLAKNKNLIGHWEPRFINKNKIDFKMNINTFDDKVLISLPKKSNNWVTHYIKDQQLADSIKNLCNYLWSTAEKIKV